MNDFRLSKAPVQEELARATDAIQRGTAQWEVNSRGWLVRMRGLAGYVRRKQCRTAEEASEYFHACMKELELEVERSKSNREVK